MVDPQVSQAVEPEPAPAEPGKAPEEKLVPEADLMAVKAGKEKLETELKKAQEEHNRVLKELNTTKEQYSSSAADLNSKLEALQRDLESAKEARQAVEGELSKTKEAGLQARRRDAVERGVPEEKVNNLSEDALDALLDTLKSWRPKPDMGAGIGAKGFEGLSPMELAQRAYDKNK